MKIQFLLSVINLAVAGSANFANAETHPITILCGREQSASHGTLELPSRSDDFTCDSSNDLTKKYTAAKDFKKQIQVRHNSFHYSTLYLESVNFSSTDCDWNHVASFYFGAFARGYVVSELNTGRMLSFAIESDKNGQYFGSFGNCNFKSR